MQNAVEFRLHKNNLVRVLSSCCYIFNAFLPLSESLFDGFAEGRHCNEVRKKCFFTRTLQVTQTQGHHSNTLSLCCPQASQSAARALWTVEYEQRVVNMLWPLTTV